MAKTHQERLAQQKELSRKRKIRMKSNPKLLEKENKKRCERYARQKEDRQMKKKKMTDRQVRKQRRTLKFNVHVRDL